MMRPAIALASAALLLAPPVSAQVPLNGGDNDPPRLRELVCRCGRNSSPTWGTSTLQLEVVQNPSDDSPIGKHYVKMKMTYEAHLTRPPGSCHWKVNIPPSSPPPGVVYFDIEAVAYTDPGKVSTVPEQIDTASIRRYLSDPNHFWIFYHWHPSATGFDSPSATVYGPLDPQVAGIDFHPVAVSEPRASTLAEARDENPTATSHVSSTEPGTSSLAEAREQNQTASSQAAHLGVTTTAEATTTVQVNEAPPTKPAVTDADTAKAPVARDRTAPAPAPARLRLVDVRREDRQVAIVFRAPPDASPMVEYSRKAPFRGSAAGSWAFHHPSRAAVKERRSAQPGRYVAFAREGLEPGKLYFFVINRAAGTRWTDVTAGQG
jgi:hypothetical protein